MVAQLTIPCALEKMLEHVSLDIERCFELMPEAMEDAMTTCQMCRKSPSCDENVESRYFVCPNRDLLDRLERIQGKI